MQKTTSETARSIRHISMELRLNGRKYSIYTFLVNPEELTHDEKARAPVTQTLTSAYIDKFGLGLPDITIQGTTGFHIRNVPGGGQTDGYERFHTLRNDVFRQFFSDGALGGDHWQLFLYQWEDNEFWEVFPMQFGLQRSKGQPLLYRYNFRFQGIKKLGTTEGSVQDHAAKVDKTDISTSVLQNPKIQAQRSYDGISTARTLLLCELGARNSTLEFWRSTWNKTLPDRVGSTLEQELFTETNYPGSGASESDMLLLVALADIANIGLKSYMDGVTPAIPLLASSVKDLTIRCRSLVAKLESLSKKPYVVIEALQDLDRAAGILIPYPEIFKPTV